MHNHGRSCENNDEGAIDDERDNRDFGVRWRWLRRDCSAPGDQEMTPPSMVLASLSLNVNGRTYTLNIPPETPLLHVLRNDLELNGPKYGCGLGECGACAVLIDGDCARACVVPVANVAGREIVTLEGLGSIDRPHPIQQAFVTAQAAQCGYCLNGMIIATKALLDRNARPSEAQIRQALKYHLCRCGTHLEILEAVHLAADCLQTNTQEQ
jgi:nicotinate dehydrogenase subunit A